MRKLVTLLLSLIILLSAVGLNGQRKPRKRKKQHVISGPEALKAIADKKKLKQKIHALGSKLDTAKHNVRNARVNENAHAENIGTVQERIAATRGRMISVNAKLHSLEAEHDQVTNDLKETEQQLKHRRFLLAQRLNENYRRGTASYTQVLLRSRTIHDMLSRGYYVRRIVQSDKKLVAEIKQDVADIAADKKKLELQEAHQHELMQEFEAQKEALAHDLTIERHLYNDAHETRVEAQQELDDLESESNAMTARIRELSNKLLRRAEEKRRVREAERRMNRLHHRPNPVTKDDDEPEVWHGGFARPCAGRVTSGFGSRYHPVLHYRRMHSGVDFGASYGAPIHAAAGGTVLLAQYNHGYGNCVIIDHGGGTTTLYGHASALLVSEGQQVRQGQTIARVGATGLATGPHLHFEVRHNGTPVQPPF